MTKTTITIRGAGITGLWQAITLAKNGYEVHLKEKDKTPFASASSHYAGAMLAPFCEEESAEPIIRQLGLQSLELWQDYDPNIRQNGSLVLAQPRERRELTRFARMTQNHTMLSDHELNELEPDLEGRFENGLFYEQEAHMDPTDALPKLLEKAKQLGTILHFGPEEVEKDLQTDWTIDCRGLAAREKLKTLRAVRGERVIIHAPNITLNRPIRLLHPRFPIYIVPWPDNHYMIGATVIESDDKRNMTVRSALELLSTAYSLHPGFGEAEIIDFGAGLRPAFPDNIPKIITDGKTLYVNGLYRHGFLLAPALAEITRDYIKTGQKHLEIFVENYFER